MAAQHTTGSSGQLVSVPLAAGLAFLLLFSGGAAAQSTRPTENRPADAGLITYSDPTFGFELRVPAGWTYDRGRFEGPAGAIGVLRSHSPDAGQALQVLIFRSFEMPGFSGWLEWFLERLGEMHGGRKIPAHRQIEGGRERATILVDTRAGGTRTQTYYLCIPFDANTVWVLMFASAVAKPADEQQVRLQFDQLATSVRVLYSAPEAQKIATGFERGLSVLQRLRSTAADVQIDETERLYDIVVGGKSIGCLARWMKHERWAVDDPRFARHGRPGLRVHEESWRFADDGTVRHTELNMFSSFDFGNELIESRTTQVPAADVPSQRLYIELDQCVREGQALVSSFSTNLDLELPEPRPPLPIGPRYLDLAWVRLLPRLVLKAPPEMLAFAVYDSQARALIVYTIKPLGPCQVPGTGGASGYAFETRAGFVSQASRLYTDQDGYMLRIESGDLIIAQSSREEVERKYAARREPARRRMQAPQRQPGLP